MVPARAFASRAHPAVPLHSQALLVLGHGGFKELGAGGLTGRRGVDVSETTRERRGFERSRRHTHVADQVEEVI